VKFRLVTKTGDGIGLAWRLMSEGEDVDFFIGDPKATRLYKGIIPRVTDWHSGLTKDDVLLFDMVGLGKEADEARSQGLRVYGASVLADRLELDRSFALDLAEQVGISVPPYQDFQDFDRAVEYLEGSTSAWVFKPEKNKEGVQTFVSTSVDQMVEMLKWYKTKWTKGKVDFVLQEVVEGLEVSSEVWYSDGQPLESTYNNTWETKRFLDGDLGPNTGCMSSTVMFNAIPQLYPLTLQRFNSHLRGYNGPLDINCIIDDSGTPWMLELTARMGYSAVYAFMELLGLPFGDFIRGVVDGSLDLPVPTGFGGALRVTIPPYPHCGDAPQDEGKPLGDLPPEAIPLDVMVQGGRLVCSGYDGIVTEVTGIADDLETLWADIYDVADGLTVPDKQYRTQADVLQDAQKRVDQSLGLDLEVDNATA
jgi:phosphoribosylamine-glycine ligase